MQKEELYHDLGCNTFSEYIEQHLKGALAEMRLPRTARRKLAATLYQEGQTQQQVADTLNVVQSTIHKDLDVPGIIEKNNSRGRPRKVESIARKVSEINEIVKPESERRGRPRKEAELLENIPDEDIVHREPTIKEKIQAGKETPTGEYNEHAKLLLDVDRALLRIANSVRELQKTHIDLDMNYLGTSRESLQKNTEKAIVAIMWLRSICELDIEKEWEAINGKY
jgi:transposase